MIIESTNRLDYFISSVEKVHSTITGVKDRLKITTVKEGIECMILISPFKIKKHLVKYTCLQISFDAYTAITNPKDKAKAYIDYMRFNSSTSLEQKTYESITNSYKECIYGYYHPLIAHSNAITHIINLYTFDSILELHTISTKIRKYYDSICIL